MEIIRDIRNVKGVQTGRCIALGTFDGIHLGHQAVINKLLERAKNMALEPAVFTFSTHPGEKVKGRSAPPLLNTTAEKVNLIAEMGIEELFLLDFNQEFAAMPPEIFVEEYLLSKLQARQLVVGFNFNFGKERMGTVALLEEMGQLHNFQVEIIPPFHLEQEVVSSTRIRKLIGKGEVGLANRLLGYPYFLMGGVVHGQKKGREIGYPTANVEFDLRKVIPASGVYAVTVKWQDQLYGGVANIGYRPTFQGKSLSLEVHIFDFAGNLYGQEIQVNFLKEIRAEFLFKNIDELIKQINKDAQEARTYLEHYPFSDFSA